MHEKQESSKRTFTSTNMFTQSPKWGMCNLHLIGLNWEKVKILLNKNITADMNFQKLLRVTNDTASLVTQDKMCRHLLSYC
jgi:hypothetical protein